jgi:uncharacterized protein YoxC
VPEFKLPKLRTLDRIVDALGRPSIAFVSFFLAFSRAIEQAVTDIQGILQEIIELNDTQDMLIEELTETQESLVTTQEGLVAAVAAIQAILGIVNASNTAIQSASEAANNAQATADQALAGGTVSGFATDPAIDVLEAGGWIPGPQVDLTGVVAGNLTIAGTGPLQDGDVSITNSLIEPGGYRLEGEFRVMEIIGGVETSVFVGAMSAFQSVGSPPASISNDSSAAVSAFSLARSSTGAVSYRLDFASNYGSATSLKGYLFARRAA